MMKKSILLIIILLNAIFSLGQNTNLVKKKNRYESYFDSLTNAKVGKPFIKDSILKTTDGRLIQINNLKNKTMVCFGMYGCHPCAQELPAIVQLSKEMQNVDFVYITFNSEQTIKTEFEEVLGKNYSLPENYHIIIMDQNAMKRNDVLLGYPTKYFLDKNGTVLFFQYGGVSRKSTLAEMMQINNNIIKKY